MIDLHCHLLPALDDGARDLEDAQGMADQARNDGITAICATPHIRHDHDIDILELPHRREELAQVLARAGCPVRVLQGAEVAASALPELSDAALGQLTLGAGRWVLLEPAPGPLDDRFDRAVGDVSSRGLRVLIAHPERHGGPDLFARLARLVADGALVQATAAFFLQGDTRPWMLELAGRGLVHVLGSDAHSSRAGRPVALSLGFAALQDVEPIGRHVDWMRRTAPAAIVHGRELSPPFWPEARSVVGR